MRLTPFDPTLAATVASWAQSEEEALAWCSRTDVPVPAEVVSAWGEAPGVTAFSFVKDTLPIGYGELWVDNDESEVELARLIIEPGHRGMRYGRQMVAELVTQAQRHSRSVIMRVHPDNDAAKRSYAAAGFVPISTAEESEWNDGQPIAYSWMTYRGA
ncbi:MAG: GNAT family N-acetyltransferase [Actinomycetota bacterium]|nr:GNAT family N-acetyltransferase [Actinomycetota bacterium]